MVYSFFPPPSLYFFVMVWFSSVKLVFDTSYLLPTKAGVTDQKTTVTVEL